MVARDPDSVLQNALVRATDGDVLAVATIAAADHVVVQEAAKAVGEPLVVTRAAAARVVQGLISTESAPSAAQAWASFMRRGYVEGMAGPTRPIEIEFDEAWEDAISATVSRLDEIDDAIDGVVTTGEALSLLRLLGKP